MTEPIRAASANGAAFDPVALDLFEFARGGAHASGTLRVADLPRMLAEIPVDAPARDAVFDWQARGTTRVELSQGPQAQGEASPRPYLRVTVQGGIWLECQRCLEPVRHEFDVVAEYLIAATEEEADAHPLDDDEADVVVGSRQFNLVELIEEELLLSRPLVPKHDVCPTPHGSLASGAEAASGGRPNPFAALGTLKSDDAEKTGD